MSGVPDLTAWLREAITSHRDTLKADPGLALIAGELIARCEAELAILDAHKAVWEGGWQECAECGPNNDSSGILAVPGDGDEWWPCRTVRLLGSGYRGRPGYREEWVP